MENEKNNVQTTKVVENWMEDSEIKNLGGNNMETNNQLVPVESEVVTGEIGIDIVKVEEIYNNMMIAQESAFLEVDQNDFEEDTKSIEIYNEIQNTKKSGAFVPLNGLTLLFVSNGGTKVFAKRVAKGGGYGNPVLVFVYTDGSVSEDVEIKMEELFIISGGNYGKLIDGIDEDDVREARKYIKQISGRILSYWSGDMEIMPKHLIKLLKDNLPALGVDRGNELDVDKVYAAIWRYVEMEYTGHAKGYMKRKGMYALTREDMDKIVNYLGVKTIDVINILKRHNLLYLQPSSIGYQCEVKWVDADEKGRRSCYCVKILAKYKHEDYEDFTGDPNLEL